MDLSARYKGNICPVCKKDLIFNHDFTEVNCEDKDCLFNQRIMFENGSEIIPIFCKDTVRGKIRGYQW